MSEPVFEATLVGDRELVASFARVGPALHDAMTRSITGEAIRLQGIVKADKLSGQVLRNRTGHGRAAITFAVDDAPGEVSARIGIFEGPSLVYMRAHEFGFEGEESVGAHERTVTQAFGRAIAPRRVTVAPFSRHMRLPERSFLRSTLHEQHDAVAARVEQAVTDAVANA